MWFVIVGLAVIVLPCMAVKALWWRVRNNG